MKGEVTSGLARLRRAEGHTQASFVEMFLREAARLGLDASLSVRQLRRWECETPPPLPHPSQQVVLEAVFGVPLAEMGFVVPAHRSSVAAPIGDSGDVKRRTFVADTGALAAAALVPARVGPRIGTADIGRLRVRLDALYQTDHTAGSVPAMKKAHRIEGEITGALGAASYAVRRPLRGRLRHGRHVRTCGATEASRAVPAGCRARDRWRPGPQQCLVSREASAVSDNVRRVHARLPG